MLGPAPEYYRSSERLPASAEIRLYDDGQTHTNAVVANIGLGGVYVDMDTSSQHTGNTLKLEFKIPGEANKVYRCTVKVAHVDEHGLGLVFENYDPESVNALRRIATSSINHH